MVGVAELFLTINFGAGEGLALDLGFDFVVAKVLAGLSVGLSIGLAECFNWTKNLEGGAQGLGLRLAEGLEGAEPLDFETNQGTELVLSPFALHFEQINRGGLPPTIFL